MITSLSEMRSSEYLVPGYLVIQEIFGPEVCRSVTQVYGMRLSVVFLLNNARDGWLIW
ncbi:hypothetical protein D3C87_2039240 [compost metagenome]